MDVAVVGGSAWFVGTLRAILAAGSGFALAVAADDVPGLRRRLEGTGVRIIILAGPRAEADLGPLVQWCRRYRPELRVVVQFPSLRPDLVRDAMQSGAWGCFAAEDAPDILLSILASVAQGRVSFPFVDLSALERDPFEQLTRREKDVLKALAQGWTNLQISARLGISENTVKYHLKLIYEKLGVANRATAVAKYIERAGG